MLIVIILAMKYQHVCILGSEAASLIHINFRKIVFATCGKNIQILDTELDVRITRISVAALIIYENENPSTESVYWGFVHYLVQFHVLNKTIFSPT